MALTAIVHGGYGLDSNVCYNTYGYSNACSWPRHTTGVKDVIMKAGQIDCRRHNSAAWSVRIKRLRCYMSERLDLAV